MKWITLLLPLCLGGCAPGVHRPTPAVVHVAPSTKKVAAHIDAASAKVVIIQKDIDAATAAADRLAASEEATIIQKSLVRITAELRETQTELTNATTENVALQKQVDDANEKFNQREREYAALTDRVKQLESENRSLSASLRWEKIKGWLKFGTVIGVGLGLIVLAFVFKIVGAGARFGAKVAPLAVL
jgi:hypothetical protein